MGLSGFNLIYCFDVKKCHTFWEVEREIDYPIFPLLHCVIFAFSDTQVFGHCMRVRATTTAT